MKGFGEVAIGIQRQRDRTVPEQILDELWMGAGCQKDACGGVAEVMHADPWQASLGQRPMKCAIYEALLESCADAISEDESAVDPPLGGSAALIPSLELVLEGAPGKLR